MTGTETVADIKAGMVRKGLKQPQRLVLGTKTCNEDHITMQQLRLPWLLFWNWMCRGDAKEITFFVPIPPPPLTVSIKSAWSPTPKVITVELEGGPGDSIFKIQGYIQEKEGITIAHQCLTYGGVSLEDPDKTLADYDVFQVRTAPSSSSSRTISPRTIPSSSSSTVCPQLFALN